MIPTADELVAFLKKNELVNFSLIARKFDIKNTTVSDLIDDMVKQKLVKVKQLGGSKVVLLTKKR